MKWTQADINRAREEGWDYKCGHVIRVFDEAGMCPFDSVQQIIRCIIAQSTTSKWHRNLYMALPWTGVEEVIANSEGWLLITSIRPNKIITTSGIFSSDEAAGEFVQEQAEKGSPLHIKALRTLTMKKLLEN